MWIDDDEYLIRCGCGDTSNPIHFSFNTWHIKGEAEGRQLDIGVYITNVGLWERLKNALFYIFKQRKFWNYGNIGLDLNDPKQRKEIEGLIPFLEKCLTRRPG